MPRATIRVVILASIVTLFLISFVTIRNPTIHGSSFADSLHFGDDGSTVAENRASTPKEAAAYIKQVLQSHDVGPEIDFGTRTIQFIPDAQDRKSITEVDEKLFRDNFRNTKISKLSSLLDVDEYPLMLHIHPSPRPDQVYASSLIFGVSTTVQRFNSEQTSPTDEWVRWLTNGHGQSNGAGLVLSLFNATAEEISQVSDKLTGLGIDATVIASDNTLDMPGRYMALVNLLFNHPSRDSRKYFSLIDDDTFFPSISALVVELSQYDPDRPYYIGTFTERNDWMLSHNVAMAFGGAGVFLTSALARQLAGLPCLAKTEEGNYVLDAREGDRLLYNCITTYTDTHLTYQPRLHQEDQPGDPSGLYESGTRFLSQHHYKSWHHYSPEKVHKVSDVCGEDCVLQRFQFNDDFILTNGYSVAQYPQGVDFDPMLMEDTFTRHEPLGEGVFSYSFGALRKDLARTGRKLQWEILDARREGDGRVRQIYVMRKGDERWFPEGAEPPSRDSVVVLVWSPEPVITPETL